MFCSRFGITEAVFRSQVFASDGSTCAIAQPTGAFAKSSERIEEVLPPTQAGRPSEQLRKYE